MMVGMAQQVRIIPPFPITATSPTCPLHAQAADHIGDVRMLLQFNRNPGAQGTGITLMQS